MLIDVRVGLSLSEVLEPQNFFSRSRVACALWLCINNDFFLSTINWNP
jgi:hypothetical protein